MPGAGSPRVAIGLAACVVASSLSLSAYGRESVDREGRRLVLEFRGAYVVRDVRGAPAEHDAKFGRNPGALTWGFEAAHHPFRLRSVGSAGLGVGLHYMHHEAIKNDGAVNESKTMFQMLLLSAGLEARLDALVSCCNVGLVPYGKVALFAAPWKMRRGEHQTESGEEQYESTSLGSGAAVGPGVSLGVQLLLDGGMRRTGQQADTSIFVEYGKSDLTQAGGMSASLTWWTTGVVAMW